MSFRLSMGVASLLLVFFAVEPASASWLKPSRLQALAARQDLCDEVAIAMADGIITHWERAEILSDAKQILNPEEYASFKRAFERIAPPPPPKSAAKHHAKIAGKNAKKPASAKVAGKKPVSDKIAGKKPVSAKIAGTKPEQTKIAGKKPASKPRSTEKPSTELTSGLVIPADAVQPDRMASISPVR